MNTPFEQDWKEKIEAARPGDLAPGFDAEAGWNAVQARLGRQEHGTRWRAWIAAILLVVFCAVGIAVWLRKDEGYSEKAKNIGGDISLRQQRPPAPATSVQPAQAVDTAAAQELPSSSRPTRGQRRRVVAPIRAKEDAQNAVTDTLAALPLTPLVDTSAQEESPSEKTSPKKVSPPGQPAPVIVHLMDVTGESGERLRRPVEPLPARRVGILARLLSRNKVPDVGGTAAADALVRRTYLSR